MSLLPSGTSFHPTLHAITPSYGGDLDKWRGLVTSLAAHPMDRPSDCDYASTLHHTIVSTLEEKQRFTATLEAAVPDASRRAHFSVVTLHSVLAAAGKSVAQDEEGTAARYATTSKYVLQSTKKAYGCVAVAEPRDTCFLLDSGSQLLPHAADGLCGVATAYFRAGAHVLVAPYAPAKNATADIDLVFPGLSRPAVHVAAGSPVLPSQGEWLGVNRMLASGSCPLPAASLADGGRHFRPALLSEGAPPSAGDALGQFYAMESYHWLWPAADAAAFLDAGAGDCLLRAQAEPNSTVLQVEESSTTTCTPRSAAGAGCPRARSTASSTRTPTPAAP